ncbi:MAG: PQQ-binding-like beta-propeller repeat protein [Planctomycetes bacterium]|nr:PQQ-binding-like beta-propeller repeat protein [Planctomycetota bacterium]
MNRMRQVAALLGIFVVVVALVGPFAEQGQALAKKKFLPPDPPIPVGGGTSSGLSSIKIIEDSTQRRVIQVGRDCIRDKDWEQAIQALQPLLELPKDFYVQIKENDGSGREVARWTSVKFEANNLIGSMELDGLQVYELKFGEKAKGKLDDAKKKGDRDMIAEVAQQYCHTKAGIEANEILATLFLARGQIFTAALRYEKLLQMNPERTKLSNLTLYKASMAFYRAGDLRNYEIVWERLQKNLKDKGKGGLEVGTQIVAADKLDAAIKDGSAGPIVIVHDWPSWRGNVRNTGQAIGSPPLMDTKLISRPIMMDKDDGANDADPDQAAKDRVEKAIKQAEAANQAVLPGFFPIVSQGIMIYRSQRDIRAVALKEVELRDEDSGAIVKVKPGEIVWKSIAMNRSLSGLLEKNNLRVKVEQWLTSYDQIPGFNSFLYDNSLIGTLFTDQRYVYAINDIAVPPHPNVFFTMQFNPQANQFQPGDMKALMMQNELAAYDLVSGKMKWDLNEQDKEFQNSHFISLPISVGGKLYVLNEKLLETGGGGQPNPFGGGWTNPFPGDSEIRLVCIDPTKLVQGPNSHKPTIVGDPQTLGHVAQHNRILQDTGRRVNAIQMAYDEGVLVCPTNAGEVFGIDLMTKALVWSYPYREVAHQQVAFAVQPGMPQPPRTGEPTTVYQKWRSSPPAIADGKIVFTAPDADSVHCISLRDGKPVWKQKQQKGDLFMAGVYNGRVLVVSETNVRAYDLNNGTLLRTVYTGAMPSGQGVASKGMYYLPLKSGEIVAIDIVKGEIKAHNRAPQGQAAPGNLVFYENMVLSQTPTEIAVYPQLVARLEQVRNESNKDPQNLTKLTDYGELLLKNGEVQPAVDSLLKAYQQSPPEPLAKRIKDRLFEALTDLMQIDFAKADKDHLTVYKALCSVPGNTTEEQNRKAKFFRLVGQGREAQGNLVEAFQMYKEFGSLPIHKDQGIASPEDPNHKIPVNVWLRGRISGMLSGAKPHQKEPLEATIAAEWKEVEAQKNPDAIRSFVGMFDIPVRVGREARVRLAEAIMERNERVNFLEAEMLLNQVMGSEYRAEPQTGGRALAALAQLEEMKGSMDSLRLAAAYYRELKRDFPDKAVRGTKTGDALFSEMATDKRYLPFLGQSSNPFGNAKLASRNLGAGSFNVGIAGFVMMPDGDQTPFAKQNRLMLDPSDTLNPKVRLRDTATNQDRWTTNLGRVDMNQSLFFHLYQQANNQQYHPNARFRFYQVKGHLIVCQVGVMVYCIDGDSGKKLWEMQTVENIPQNGVTHLQQVANDTEGNPEFHYWNQLTNQKFKVSLGRIGTAQASYVAVIGHKGLSVHEPLTGKVMWKRQGVSINSHVFGDEQYMFLAEANGNGGFGAGVTIRAADGEVLQTQDFSNVYSMRVRTMGRQILAGVPGGGVRLYDILSGKDVWRQPFPQGSHVLHSEDSNIVGVLEPNGKLTVLDDKGKVLVTSNLVQGRITVEDIKGLQEPLLLQDADRFYVALNRPLDPAKIAKASVNVNGVIQTYFQFYNNFNNGTRCLNVNGWFVAVHRNDTAKAKKGDLAWHSYMPIHNQMIVLDQFEQSPIVLFTARYIEVMPNGGNRWASVAQSLHKATGKMIHDSGTPPGFNGQPSYAGLQLDLKARVINLISFSASIQHYVDDGKGPPPGPQGALPNGGNPAFAGIAPPAGGVGQPNGQPMILPAPAIRLRIVDPDEVQVIPAPELPPIKKR